MLSELGSVLEVVSWCSWYTEYITIQWKHMYLICNVNKIMPYYTAQEKLFVYEASDKMALSFVFLYIHFQCNWKSFHLKRREFRYFRQLFSEIFVLNNIPSQSSSPKCGALLCVMIWYWKFQCAWYITQLTHNTGKIWLDPDIIATELFSAVLC